MRIISKANSLRKGILLYRGIRYRKGHGVHSPFAFNLITKVIEEKCLYYSFQDIERLRKLLLNNEQIITYQDRHKPGKIRRRTVAEIVKREAIKPKQGALLFRLTNYFKSQRILQLGPSIGLSTLYLTSYATNLKCIAIEKTPELGIIAGDILKHSNNPIDLRIGDYYELLPQALKDLGSVDFVFFNTGSEQQNNEQLFNTCMNSISDDTVFVFDGIKVNGKMRKFWKKICADQRVSITVDLYSMGLVFFNKRLHKRNYIVYF